MKNLILFAQSSNIYVCDFTKGVEVCTTNIHTAYFTPTIALQGLNFDSFNELYQLTHAENKLKWLPNQNVGESDFLVFKRHIETGGGSHICATCRDPTTSLNVFITLELFGTMIAKVIARVQRKLINMFCLTSKSFLMLNFLQKIKMLCILGLVQGLANLFQPNSTSIFSNTHIVNATSILDLQFQMKIEKRDMILEHEAIINFTFARTKKVQIDKEFQTMKHLLFEVILERQQNLFRATMENNLALAMQAIDMHLNPITKLWKALAANHLLKPQILL